MKNTYRLVVLCMLLLLSAGVLSAQSGDLLTNGGFEAPFLPLSGDIPSNVAAGWSPWYVPAAEGQSASDNVMPEFFAASDTVNGLSLTTRIHGGADAQQYFSYYSTHTGGLYQQVSGIAPGSELTFSVFAYLWASDASETSDGSGEIAFSIGIDPSGGTDGQSASIVWSEPSSVYDDWSQSSVTATATGAQVTVFIRSTATAKIANNVIYVDDASLTGAGGAVVTEATPEATDVATAEAPVAVEPTTEVAPTVEVTEAAPVVTEAPATVEATEAVTEAAPVATEALPTVESTVEVPTEAVPTTEPTVEVPTEAAVEVTAEPTVPASPVPSPTLDTTAFPQSFTYTVQTGDTVNDLALRYGSTIDAIITANGLNQFGFIQVGQTLIIPVSKLPTAETATVEAPTVAAPAETTVPPTATVIVPTSSPVPPTSAAVNPAAVSQPVTYVIQFGDTLSSIAFRFGTTVRELSQLNGITNPNLIYYGQLLVISLGSPTPATSAPATVVAPTAVPTAVSGQTYRVLLGDNLYTISLRFGVPVSRLIEANNLSNPNRIYVGQVLVIPAP